MATINPDIHQKFRSVKKLPSKQSEDGNAAEVEIREDEKQSVKLQEIIDLLVAAGYFRARIKGLSPFDKIVGGMTWCIESCNIDIDVDLLFQENSTIGQKIALTEKIVAVLPKMKCPHRIEPHQIQGLDCIHIFPVIQWLVKRSMEFRQAMSDFVRSYAVSQFNKEFPIDDKQNSAQKQVIKNINTVREVYRPRRYYRRKLTAPEDIQSRVHYGMQGHITSDVSKTTESDSLEQKGSSQFNIQKLVNYMTTMQQDNAECFILNEEEQREFLKHYATLKSELEDNSLKSREEKQLLTMQQQKQILADKCSKLQEEIGKLESTITDHTTELQNIKHKEADANRALKEFIKDEKEYNAENLKEIEELVILNDSLKSQELKFREHCKQELANLKQLIEQARNAKTPEEANPEISKEVEEESTKLKIIRLQLAKKNRSVAALQRKLDEIPSRAELAQYQRRFLELYNQVASKHKETKQYYTLYNTLEDTRLYIQKELSLLNSICDSYPEAILSNSGKEEFLKQFETIVEGVKQSKQKVEQKLAQEKHKRDQLSQNLHTLVEQQRKYVTAVRQLSIECRKHEALLSQHNF